MSTMACDLPCGLSGLVMNRSMPEEQPSQRWPMTNRDSSRGGDEPVDT